MSNRNRLWALKKHSDWRARLLPSREQPESRLIRSWQAQHPGCYQQPGYFRPHTTVPYFTAVFFAEAMQKAGNRCELLGFEKRPLGFFNYGRAGNKMFVATTRAMDQFLVSLGYLSGKPTSAPAE